MPPPGEPPAPTPTDGSPAPAAGPTIPDRIPLPPPAAAPPDAPPRRRRAALDSIFAVIVLGFAFLVASAPAHNSDLWLHLATGRDLLMRKMSFGVDPFAQGTAGVYWVNTNWLYDVFSYAAFQAGGGLDGMGGAALVLLKALLVTALAAVLLRLGWCGRGLWAPAVGAAWAVLVLGPWLAPHPMIVSYLFLALTLYFLERPQRPAAETGSPRAGPVRFTAYWPLLPLFVLWVNLDSWFLLGPLTVALYLLGQLLQSRYGPGRGDAAVVRPSEAKSLALMLAVGLTACLLNPYHVYAFLTPPAQLGLSPAAGVLRQDPAFQALLLSPFQSAYMHAGGPGWNAAGWAYVLLVFFSGASFLLNFGGWRWRWLLAWAAAFALSAFQVRAVPFFAIVAGPLLALNVQAFLARRAPAWAKGAEARRWAAAGRAATLLGGLALIVLGWPGWLHAPPCEPPRWQIEADAGLRRAAEQAAEWRRKGDLGPNDLGFNLSSDAANYFAWFCPEEKGVLDARHTLFPVGAAADFVKVRKELSSPGEPQTFEEAHKAFVEEALAPEDGADPAHFGGAPMAAVRDVLRRRGADHLIVYDSDRQTDFSWIERLRQYPREWPLLCVAGRAAVFGWRDPEALAARDRFAGLALDLDRLAFRPPDAAKAPAAGPDREPAAPDWTDALLKSRAARTSLADEADLYLACFDHAAPAHGYRGLSAWQRSLVAASVGAAACADGSVVSPCTMAMPWAVLTAPAGLPKDAKPTPPQQFAFWQRGDYTARQDDGPVGLLYLALRAARRAVREDPDDAHAYLVLGGVYKRLMLSTGERAWNPPRAFWGRPIEDIPLAYRVRTAEAVAAYKSALRINPDLEPAHMDLIALYQEMDYQDEVLNHVREVLRCNRQGGPRAGESQKQFAERIRDLEGLVADKEKEIKSRSDQFEVDSANRPVYARAELAWKKYGLAGKALSVLLAAHVEDFGREGEALELELLLHTGRLREVRTWVEPDKAIGLLGALPFLEIQVQLEAAAGNYEQADADLTQMIDAVHAQEGPAKDRIPARAGLALGVANALLQSLTVDGCLAYVSRTGLHYPKIVRISGEMTAGIVEEANLTALRGVLALERGEVEKARGFFGEALAVWGDEGRAASGAGLDFPARPAAQGEMERLRRAGPERER